MKFFENAKIKPGKEAIGKTIVAKCRNGTTISFSMAKWSMKRFDISETENDPHDIIEWGIKD